MRFAAHHSETSGSATDKKGDGRTGPCPVRQVPVPAVYLLLVPYRYTGIYIIYIRSGGARSWRPTLAGVRELERGGTQCPSEEWSCDLHSKAACVFVTR